MDLRFAGVAPSEREKTALDALLGAPPGDGGRPPDSGGVSRQGPGDGGCPPDSGGVSRQGQQSWRGDGAMGERRHLLLPAIHAVHDATGWVSRGALDEIAPRLEGA